MRKFFALILVLILTITTIFMPNLEQTTATHAQVSSGQLNIAFDASTSSAMLFTIQNNEAQVISEYTFDIEGDIRLFRSVTWATPNVGLFEVIINRDDERITLVYIVDQNGIRLSALNDLERGAPSVSNLFYYSAPYAVLFERGPVQGRNELYILNTIENTVDILTDGYLELGLLRILDDNTLVYPAPSFPASEIKSYDFTTGDISTLYQVEEGTQLLPTALAEYWYDTDPITDENNVTRGQNYQVINILTGETPVEFTFATDRELTSSESFSFFQSRLTFDQWLGTYDRFCVGVCAATLYDVRTGQIATITIPEKLSEDSVLQVIHALDDGTLIVVEDNTLARETELPLYVRVWRAPLNGEAELIGYIPMDDDTDLPTRYDPKIVIGLEWMLVGDERAVPTLYRLIDLETNVEIFSVDSQALLNRTRYSPYGLLMRIPQGNLVFFDAVSLTGIALPIRESGSPYLNPNVLPNNQLVFAERIDMNDIERDFIILRNVLSEEETILFEGDQLIENRYLVLR